MSRVIVDGPDLVVGLSWLEKRGAACGEVRHLRAGLARAPADVDFVRLTGADHVLKQDPTGSAAGYTEPLPFSPQIQRALRASVGQHLS